MAILVVRDMVMAGAGAAVAAGLLAAVLLAAGCRSPVFTGAKLAEENRRAAAVALTAANALAAGSSEEAAAVRRFSDFYADYSAAAIRAGVRKVYAPDAWFADPFHVVSGIDAIETYFLKMAEPVESCAFTIDGADRAGGDHYFRWTMRLVSKAAGRQPIVAIGVSHVRFNGAGLVVFQQDYWDTGLLFERLPVVGGLVRWIKVRLEK
jgi:hypothetical protein